MAEDETEELLLEIGALLAEDVKYPLDGTLLYARLAQGVVAPSIFKDLGSRILYRRPDLGSLGDALLDLWEAQEGDVRWAEMEYVVRDGRFEVTYTYPDEIDPNEDNFDRRDRVVHKHFGNKPIVYPPFEEDANFPTYEL